MAQIKVKKKAEIERQKAIVKEPKISVREAQRRTVAQVASVVNETNHRLHANDVKDKAEAISRLFGN